MSLTYKVVMHCDNCGEQMGEAKGDKAPGLASLLLKRAKDAGWSRDTKSVMTDLCPCCLDGFRKGDAK